MITHISIKNFKTLESLDIALGSSVVFAGPNNCGKTSALQAFTLFDIAVKKWAELRMDSNSKAKTRTGVPIQVSDMLAIPVSSVEHLWKDLNVRETIKDVEGKNIPKNILIEIDAEGKTFGKEWKIGFEFYYSREILFYCRLKSGVDGEIIDFPKEILHERIGLLPPMSGLTSIEDKLEIGSILRKVGEGKTSDILRNLCYLISQNTEKWLELVKVIKEHFYIELQEPRYNSNNGTITMKYKYKKNADNKKYIEPELDILDLGSGAKQVVLLFSYILSTENTVLLLDEPEAHLEFIRQKSIFNTLTDLVNKNNSQLIIATHSESVLNEAAEKSDIIAFIGKPHKVNNKSQLIKSLVNIGFDQYLLAEQKKWILYLEGSTDLSILKAFAERLNHPSKNIFDTAFVSYQSNQPATANSHFSALQEAIPDLKAIALFDKIDKKNFAQQFPILTWSRNEIENYIPLPHTIEYYFREKSKNQFSQHKPERFTEIFNEEVPPAAQKSKIHSFWFDTKMSAFIEKILKIYFEELKIPITLRKSNYYELIQFINPKEIDTEITEKLDAIYNLASKVK